MKRYLLTFLALAVAGVAAVWQLPAPPPTTLAGMVPAGASLVLEAADFAALLGDWQTSRAKSTWLAGDNYKVFSRSVLFLRLGEVRDQFAGAAGVDPDMSLVRAVAGGRSILALYNTREIEFLYVTRLPTAKAVETVLWKKRNDYQPRESAGVPYYVRAQSGRQVAFAATGDYLLLATREDLIGRALGLMKAQAGIPAVSGENWFSQVSAAAGAQGDLRLTVDMQAMSKNRQFKTYWIQGNLPELAQYRSAVSDLRREAGQMLEERILLREQASEAPTSQTTAIAAMIPQGAGLYRIWSAPSADLVIATLRSKALAPGTSEALNRMHDAPQVSLGSGETGGEGDLETRIDEAPLAESGGAFDDRPLRKLLETSTPRAMLLAQTARDIPGGVFAGTRSVVIVEADSWDAAAVRAAIGDRGTVRERFLIVGEVGRAITVPPALGQGVVYAASFAHAQERAGYVKMLRLIERPQQRNEQPENQDGDARQPLFFSENLASLSQALQSVTGVSIVVRDTGRSLQQSVVYRIGQ